MARNKLSSRFRSRLAAALLALTACAQPRPAGPALPVTWNAQLELPNLTDLDARLAKPFDSPLHAVRGGQAVTITNCDGYLAQMRRGARAANDREQRLLEFRGAQCRALDLLRSARPARRSALSGTILDARVLPPTLSFLPSDADRRRALAAQARGSSWQDAEPDVKVTAQTPEQATFETSTGYVRIDRYARGDFNQDGVEDVLLRVNSYARQGTYATTRLFLLTREREGQVLRVLREFE